jgi:hypothetical protein
MMNIHTYDFLKDMLYSSEGSWYVAAFMTPKENRKEITKWCYKTYGAPGMNHLTKQIRWKDSIQYGEVYFSHQKDLEWFILRWS